MIIQLWAPCQTGRERSMGEGGEGQRWKVGETHGQRHVPLVKPDKDQVLLCGLLWCYGNCTLSVSSQGFLWILYFNQWEQYVLSVLAVCFWSQSINLSLNLLGNELSRSMWFLGSFSGISLEGLDPCVMIQCFALFKRKLPWYRHAICVVIPEMQVTAVGWVMGKI